MLRRIGLGVAVVCVSQAAWVATLAAPSATPAAPAAPAPATKPATVLSAADINKIRLAELQVTDKVVIRFEKDVEQRYAAANAVNLVAFRQASPAQRAIAIRETRDAAMMADVKIASDPAVLQEFRTIQTVLLAGCATAGCHGGGDSGKFMLINLRPDTLETLYTNFYILQQYSHDIPGDGSPFSGGKQPMIDRARPQASLVLQYALKPELAKDKHPAVAGMRPMFADSSLPNYQRILAWVGKLNSPAPEYGITFTPPSGRAPATKPAVPVRPAAPAR